MTSLVALLTLGAQSGIGAGTCYGVGREGAGYGIRKVFNHGVVSVQDIEAASVPNLHTVVHPMQIYSITGDWIGFGTIRGEGSQVHPDTCPDHYSSGWHVYIDGIKDGKYFCRHVGPVIPGNVTGKIFRLVYKECNGIVRWMAKYDGHQVACQMINDDHAYHFSVGGEVKGPVDNPQNQHIDTHFASLKYHRREYGTWHPWKIWSADRVVRCEDFGYDLRMIADDDVWVEEHIY